MERLNHIIDTAVNQQAWKRIQCSRKGPLLSSLFFADDIVLFAEATVQQARIIKDCLQRFDLASGEKVSLEKSRIYFFGDTSAFARVKVCNELQTQQTEDLSFYFGMPTLSGRVSRATFQHIFDNFDKRLAGWKSRCLSLAGRVMLAKWVLSTLPIYSMQTARLLRTLCDDLDRRTRRFIWGGDDGKRRVYLINWEIL